MRRSTLSYYQNTYPTRIDFGKVQYGGPFTNEQVEDTKTVLRLLVGTTIRQNHLHGVSFPLHMHEDAMSALMEMQKMKVQYIHLVSKCFLVL